MKNFKEVQSRLKNELNVWMVKQTNNIYSDYYLYYIPQTVEHDSGLIICKDKPPNNEYVLACNYRIDKSGTIESNFIKLSEILFKLPVLTV